MGERRVRRREARRDAGRAAVASRVVEPLVGKLPLVEVLSTAGVEKIHQASMRLLQETGILIIDYPPALETFRQNGAIVEGELVKIDAETLLHFVGQAPSHFTQLARNNDNARAC